MCLLLHTQDSETPYNNLSIRWKVFRHGRGMITFKPSPLKMLQAPYRRDNFYSIGKRYSATLNRSPTQEGFHVFVTRKEARSFANDRYSPKNFTARKVKVSGFLRKGFFNCKRCETWKQMTIVDNKK